ncbi:hypothetical protein AGR4C_pa10001 [Agrobacterium tumefaciens str. Kerr 14]|uniref:Uncharacterized protein n=1 Tax=Agrobacterium tumefaciens str. Kerr 14 TaxID=1183424 RepID=A0A1S7S995_AGRTU|nr:hypothetical protein AGR4C_pa10001 [Agrobacterium tumefaciens str. Kerr 14]
MLCRAGTIRRQGYQGGCIRQFCAPIVCLRFLPFPAQPPALPRRIVRVLDRKFRQGIRSTRGEGGIEHLQFPIENAHRPAVGDDVVLGQQQHVLIICKADQPAPHQRTSFQVKGRICLLGANLIEQGPGIAFVAQVMLQQQQPRVCGQQRRARLTFHHRECVSPTLVPCP